MAKSLSIPIALSELTRCTRLRFISRRNKRQEKFLEGFVIFIENTGREIKLYGSSPVDQFVLGDEIVSINDASMQGRNLEEIAQFITECIRKQMIELKIRKTPVSEDRPSTSSSVTDAYLVCVKRENREQLSKQLKTQFPGIRLYDMEVIKSDKQLSNISTNANNGAPSMDNDMDNNRLHIYENDVRERQVNKLQRQKENDLLRASLRSSKKLKSLSTPKQGKDSVDGEANSSYVNASYDLKEKEHNNNNSSQNIPLKQVIGSVERISEQLSRLPGHEEDSRILKDYFESPPIREAIEATAERRAHVENVANHCVNDENQKPDSSESDGLRVVTVTKGADSFMGATVRTDGNRVIVVRIVKGGIADKQELLHEGDELIELNGTDLRGKSVSEVCELIRTTCGELRFVIAPAEHSQNTYKRFDVMNIRALFDYDPEDDRYVPCRELALKFGRGDVLHVVNKSDENWWQAYREGDDVHGLPGLIPSSSFREQVVLEELALEEEMKPKRKVFCFPNTLSASSKKSSQDAFRSKDEPPMKKDSVILTYELVKLYLPRSDSRRPFILCGPEGVGCLELRQRFLETDTYMLASPVPYTSRPPGKGEEDGVHYHFISAQQFKEESQAGKFVEYGLYQDFFYGTALDDIVTVIKRGKTCVLTLKPESLAAIRVRDIKPVIIYISPPSLLHLRRQRECAGQFNVKDDQLKSIIDHGKLIEQHYGHLFDAVIVNIDPERSLQELVTLHGRLSTMPQWVPSGWVS